MVFCNPDVVDPILIDFEENETIPPAHDVDFVQLVNCVVPDWTIPVTAVDAVTLFARIVGAVAPYL